MSHGTWKTEDGGVPRWLVAVVAGAGVAGAVVWLLTVLWVVLAIGFGVAAAVATLGVVVVRRAVRPPEEPLLRRLSGGEARQAVAGPRRVIEQRITNVNVFGAVSGDDIARIIAAQQQVPGERPAIERYDDGH